MRAATELTRRVTQLTEDLAAAPTEAERDALARETLARLDASFETGPRVETDTGARTFRLREILDDPKLVELPSPIVPRLAWPGRATLLAGPEKDGKSTLTAAGGAALSAGCPFLGCPLGSGLVLWATEEHVGDVARRFARFGADPDGVVLMQWGSDALGEIRSEVEHLRPALVVIDTLAALAEHAAPESGSSAQWARVMRPLVRVARDTDAALLILHHARRSDGKYRDSSEIGAAVDVIVEMSGPPTGTVRRLSWRGRYGRGRFAVRLEGDRFELLDEQDGGELERNIRAHLRDHPGASLSNVRDAVPGRSAAVAEALAALIDRGVVTDDGGDRGHRYRLVGPVPEVLPGNGAGNGPEALPVPAVPAVPASGYRDSETRGTGGGKVPFPRSRPRGREGNGLPCSEDFLLFDSEEWRAVRDLSADDRRFIGNVKQVFNGRVAEVS